MSSAPITRTKDCLHQNLCSDKYTSSRTELVPRPILMNCHRKHAANCLAYRQTKFSTRWLQRRQAHLSRRQAHRLRQILRTAIWILDVELGRLRVGVLSLLLGPSALQGPPLSTNKTKHFILFHLLVTKNAGEARAVSLVVTILRGRPRPTRPSNET